MLVFNIIAGVGSADAATFQSPTISATATTKTPDVILQKGNSANATIYANSTSAAITTPTKYYPTSYNVIPPGTYSSGTVPDSVNAIDSNYFVVVAGGGNPRTAETEFIFAVTSPSPTQLNFTIVESYTIGGVTVTIQVFNYTGNAYPTSGQGYFTYTSSATSGTDETQSLTITGNPQFYVSASHQVKLKILGSRNGGWNQQVNFLRMFYYQSSSTFDYVLKIVNQQATAYNIKLDASPFTPSSIGRVSNFTAWFYTPTSVQLQIITGSMTTQTGPVYTLGASATIFLAIRLTTTSSGLSTVDSYLRIYPSGSTTTHTDYRLTFKMT